jgi:hypothetical protein
MKLNGPWRWDDNETRLIDSTENAILWIHEMYPSHLSPNDESYMCANDGIMEAIAKLPELVELLEDARRFISTHYGDEKDCAEAIDNLLAKMGVDNE